MGSLVTSRTYKKKERFFGVAEFSDKADADNCIQKLDGKRVHDSEMRLRCIHGILDGERDYQRTRDKNHDDDRHRSDRDGPRTGRAPLGDIRPGDWTCPNCGLNVFASRMACIECGTSKHDRKSD